MGSSKILDEFSDIVVWAKGEQRAPHKPLLILYALGALSRGEEKLLFSDVEKPLRDLLKEYGSQRKGYHPEYPFWRLKNDGIWELDNAEKCETRIGNTDAKITELRANAVRGYFRDDVRDSLKSNKLVFAEVVKSILEAHFPETLHEELQDACGITLEFSRKAKKRDPAFRERVLRAYQYRCAICGFRAQMDGRHLALEAAHIKWHAAGGPDTESNGIAMCSLHHKLFDKGAFMISGNKMLLSENVYGNSSFEEMFLIHHGVAIDEPVRQECAPSGASLKWHETEVFKGPARNL
ncbi:MAG: HNH endonuclease [Pseudomonadales bacterium]